MNPTWTSRPRILFAGAFLTALLAPMTCAAARFETQAGAVSPEVKKLRSYAESQHEIVLILIHKKEFTQALGEANKIFELNWPASQEGTVRKELLFIADQFLHADQAQLGVRLIDANLKMFKNNADRAAILKEKGYLHKAMGQGDKALDCFREAQRLEKIEK